MAKEYSFVSIYDGMNYNYGKLEGIMGDLYQYLQDNPADEIARNILDRLGSIGQNMLFSQKEFTSAYGDPSLKDSLIDNLDSKAEALKKAQEETKAKSR